MQALWNEVLYRPIYNLLVMVMDILPNNSFGWAIIIVTIIIKTIVLIPAKRSIKSQQAMQKIQPELLKIREKYKNDKQAQAQKTMELYKKHNVHPLSSCLPLLIQFPVLIALFLVTKNGLDNDPELLYAPLRDFDFSLAKTKFLGILDLVNPSNGSRYIMPALIAVLQFLQMFRMQNRKSKTVAKKTEGPNPQAIQKNMMYVMPLFLAFIASSYQAALSLYWAVSTIYTIVQQEALIHRRKDTQNETKMKKNSKKIKTAKVVKKKK